MSEQPLLFTNRLYKYIKASAIVSIVQAGVELVTNADDAYKRKSPPDEFNFINSIVDYKDKQLIVYDQALGLTYEEMEKCFGQVGDYTSTMLSRGYFSRGAKDISAIGNVTFTAIKDGFISEVQITTSDIFVTKRKDVPVTQEDRNVTKIINNGLHVRLNVKPSIVFPSFEEVGKLSNYYSMRDIFKNDKNKINIQVINEGGIILYNGLLKYIDPPIKKVLVDEVYEVEGYPGVTARFVLELLENPVELEEYGSYMTNGILVSSVNAIHEVSTLYNDVRNHPYMSHIRGRLDCDHINKLMYDYDANPDDITNPFPVIDHSRLNGLDRSHPFTKALFRLPHKQLKYILQDLYNDGEFDEDFSDNLMSLFKNVELFGSNFFKEMLDNVYNYRVSDTPKIIGYLKKKAGQVLSSSEDSSYKFNEPTNLFEGDGNVVSEDPVLSIKFSHKEFLTYPYYIYRIDNNIFLEINLNDFLVQKYIKKSEEGSIQMLEKSSAQLLLVDIIGEALAREILKEKYDKQNFMMKSNTELDVDTVFSQLENIKSVLIPKLYELIISEKLNIIN